jgi:hypothetical protein
LIPAFALTFTGFTALCLSMERHQEQVLHRRSISTCRRRVFLCAGFLLLTTALYRLVGMEGWGNGLLLWFGILSVDAMLIAMLLCYRPAAIPRLAAALLMLSMIRSFT